MTPDEFVRSLQSRPPSPAYLLVGPEGWDRDRCRRALLDRVLPPEERESGLVRHDLDEVDLDEILDDAQSFSLFATNRVIWVSSAESALPRGRAAAAAEVSDDDETGRSSPKDGSAARLATWMKNPTPGTVLVFVCSRYELDGDDKARVQRVQKFYGAIRDQVECARYTPEHARRLASQLARDRKINIADPELELLVEVLSGDAQRIANELEKLAMYARDGRAITEEDI